MKKYQSWIALTLVLMLLFTGCSNGVADSSNTGTDDSSLSDEDSQTDSSNDGVAITDSSDMFSDRDYEVGYDESESAIITLNGTSANCDSDAVQISGSTVTIIDEGTYILSGELSDGMIIVNAENTDKLQLVLNGVSVTSSTSAALYIQQADKVFVTTAAGTENALSNSGEFVAIDDNNIDAAVFSKDDLTFNGQGSLTIESPAGHGIVSKDDLVVTSGDYVISCASQAMNGKESVRIAEGEFVITAGKDGIHSEDADDASLGFVYIQNGTFTISAEGDGISASSTLQIENGDFHITAGGGSVNGTKTNSGSYGQFMGGGHGGRGNKTQSGSTETTTDTTEESTSMKGMKAGTLLTVNGGAYVIDSADDGLHSNGSMTISGGTYEVASGDDGFHAEETLKVTSGTISITECYEGLEALDIEVSGGDISLVATDDGLNAAGGTDSSGMGGRDNGNFGGGGGGMFSSGNGSIVISGGTLYINSSGDGIDANGTLEITGGYTTVCGPTQGDTATLDYDKSAVISGGTFIGTGASGMAQSFSNSEQGVIAVSVGNQAAGTQITLQDASGNTILTHAPELAFAVVILSSPDIVSGETYTITVGADSGTFEAN